MPARSLDGGHALMYLARIPAGATVLLASVSGAMMALGLAFAGPVADAIGVRPWYTVAGAVTGAMTVATVFVLQLMGIEAQAAERARG